MLIQIIQFLRKKRQFMYKSLKGKRDVYLDVADKYARYIELGVIKNGEKLPSVREVAGEIGINPNTVARAYAELEERGYIRSVPKKGAFVTYGGEEQSALEAEARALVEALYQRGVTQDELEQMIKEVYSQND